MASKTTNYNLDMPGYTDIADIDVINGNMNKIDMQMKKNADSAQQSKYIVSDEYSATKTYEVGDYCIRENVLYKCKTAITTGEAFDSNKWVQTTCGTGFRELNSNLVELKENSTIVKKSVGKFINDKGTLDGKAKLVNLPHNLLNPTLETITLNGVTCTANGDGTYTLNGTATQNTSFKITESMIYEFGKTYKIVGCPTLNNVGSCRLYALNGIDYGMDIGTGKVFTIDETNVNYKVVLIWIRSGVTVENIVFKPMITECLDTTYDDFVPYSGYEVKSCGKNLLNPILETTTKNGVTCTNNGDGTYTLNGTATAYTLFDIVIVKLNAGTYRLIGCPSGGSSKTYWFYAYIYSSYGEYGSGCNIKAKNDGDNATVKIVINSGATVENLVFKPMITTDLTATYDDYEPYQSSSVTVTQDTTEAWLDTYENETNILSPLSVTAMYGTNLQGNEIMTDLYESDNEVAKLKNDLGGLSFSVSGTTLSITDGTNTWTLESN